MAIKFTFKRPDPDRRVTNLSVTYGGYCGRKIVFGGTILRFRNVASPLMAYEKFPEGFFDERVRVLTPVEARKLSKALCRIDMSGLKSDEYLSYLNDSMIHTHFWCRFNDGWEFRYETGEQPPETFKRLVSLLTAYCDKKAVTAKEKREIQVPGRTCPQCGKLIPADAKFCPCCGELQRSAAPEELTPVEANLEETLFFCTKCENTVRYEYAFCPACGNKL